jgi:hypothetical protein
MRTQGSNYQDVDVAGSWSRLDAGELSTYRRQKPSLDDLLARRLGALRLGQMVDDIRQGYIRER